MRTPSFYSVNNLCVKHTAVLITFVTLCVLLIWLQQLAPLTSFIQFPSPKPKW